MALSPERLHEISLELASRPHHEKVRSLVAELLINGLGAKSTEIDFERQVPEVRGRIDALLGRTLFEFKSDLRRERGDAEAKLPDYLAQREKEAGVHFIGVATDGATFIPYELRLGRLVSFPAFATHPDDPHGLLAWLSSVVAVNEELEPDSDVVKRELGRDSLAWNVARHDLEAIWQEVGKYPDISLKRNLWAQLLRMVYGVALDEDTLFLQHTYLTVIAKTMAAKALGVPVDDPSDLLSGRRFREAGIGGVVESDFFDWPLASSYGADLVNRIAMQAGRFRLEEVKSDVLKGLYESLIDPEQRHFLGEYYTPDWLAESICDEAIKNPLEQRVLDPACGSGTFVFHAVRLLLHAAEKAKIPVDQAIERACRQVFGVDVHPVAVQIARVTFLLAIGQKRLKHRPATLNIPVYIGDSLQWNTSGFMVERHVLIEIPKTNRTLEFPYEVARDPVLFDSVIGQMLEMSQRTGDTPADGLLAWMKREHPVSSPTLDKLSQTYAALHYLHKKGEDHIWGFVARNLVRPLWLSQQEQKADVIVGNPPWLSYRYMDADLQSRFRAECEAYGIWAGGKVATHQDLSAYFFIRCMELYLKPSGTITFIMPYAAMTRKQFDGFRKGLYGASQRRGSRTLYLAAQFTDAWVLADDVQPLFPVPSCVLFANMENGSKSRLPKTVSVASGTLPKRDASLAEAKRSLTWQKAAWPAQSDGEEASSYSSEFHQGATFVPRMLCVVEPVPSGKLGANPDAPVVQSRRTSQEKEPWKGLSVLRDNVEKEFLRTLYLGESVAPFRLLKPVLAIVPWDGDGLLDSNSAQKAGYVHLSRWLANAERLWEEHGQGRMTFSEQLDYYGKLSAQFPTPPLRVAYSKAGTLPAAALLLNPNGIVDHKLYWASIDSKSEGHYLLAILNSETAREKAEHLQSRGQWGARDFDKVVLSLPIPKFQTSNKLHQALSRAASQAERVAADVPLPEGVNFIKARQLVRSALHEDGIAQEMDKLVAELLRL